MSEKLARGLFFDPKRILLLKERIAAPRYTRVWEAVRDTAEAVSRANSLLLEGDTFTIWYYARNRLMDLAIYVMLTGDADCARALGIILRDLAGRDIDFWQGPHYPNRPRTITYRGEELLAGELETAQLAMGISIACDWAWDYLDENTRRLVKQALREKGMLLLRNSVRFQSEKWVMNHLCVISTGLSLSAMLLGEEGDQYKDDLTLAQRGLELWMEKIEDDGSYGESYHYWAYPINCLFLGLYAFRNVLGRELAGAQRLTRCLDWALYNQVGKQRVAGYDEPLAVSVNHYDCPYLFQMEAPEALLFSRFFNLPLGRWYIERFLLEDTLRPDHLTHWWHTCNSILFALDEEGETASPADLFMSPAAYFADTGFVFIRDGWKNCGGLGGDTVLALQSGGGGRSRSHEHYDKNSFSLFAGGEYLISDPGHSCYRGESHHAYDTSTKAHNTLCIDGQNQTLSFVEKGMLHDEAIRHPSYNNQAVIVGKNFQKDISYISSEARKCYTPYLNRFTRRVLYLRPDFFLLWDSIDTGPVKGVAKNGFNINNYDGKTEIEVDGNQILVRRPLQHLQALYLWPEGLNFEQEDAKLHMAYHILPNQAVEGRWGSAKRLTPLPESPNKTDYLYLLYPHAPGGVPLTADVEEATQTNGLLSTLTLQVICGGRKYRFQVDGEDLIYKGPLGETYRF